MKISARFFRITLVVSRFNERITALLAARCREELERNGVLSNRIKTIAVPGAYELPFVAYKIARSKKVDAVICLGCVIKGQTSHDQFVSQWASIGIGLTGLLTGTPVLFGVLTPRNERQALQRVRKGPLDRGKEIAEATLEMIQMSHQRRS